MILTKHHIVLYALIVVFALGLTYTIESKVADRSEQKYEQLQAISNLKDQQNTQFQQQIAQQVTQLQAQTNQLQADKVQQATIITNLTQQLTAQKAKDVTLPPAALADRISTLAPGGTVTVDPRGYLLDQAAGVAVVQTLESVPVLQQQLTADNKAIKDDDGTIANDATVLAAEKQSHTSDVGAVQAKLDASNQEITAVKEQARKSKFKWFLAGVVTGFTLGRIHNLTF